MAKDFVYQIHKDIITLSINSRYENSLQVISWNDYEPKFDIRRWRIDDEGNRIPTKGISLTPEEMENLKKSLNEIDDFEKYLEQNA